MSEVCPHCGQKWARWVDRQMAWELIKPYYVPGTRGKNGLPRLNGRVVSNESDRKYIEELKGRYGRTHLGKVRELLVWAGLDLRLIPHLVKLVL